VIRVQAEDFDIGNEISIITNQNQNIGGICSFTGLVREFNPNSKIQAMTLEHYPGMTEKQLSKIENEAHERWDLSDSLIIHRFGCLKPKDRIVLVITASAHRKAAFESCQFLMDWLKTKAPFWKMEETATGSHWVAAKSSDDLEVEKWSEKNK